MPPGDATVLVKHLAAEVGFDRCGITKAEAIGRVGYLDAWLEAGRAGSMAYLRRYRKQRTDPQALLDRARSVIVVALSYNQPRQPAVEDATVRRGRVAMYAWGSDYHTITKDKLSAMVDRLRDELPYEFGAKICVDTSPLLEREVAAAAGVGWIGKNTMVLHRRLGSYFFLGEIVTTLELTPDEPLPNRCGTCTACLDACPTRAFPLPYEMDASRCISYLTIEHRGDIPAELQKQMRDWVFGCDVCQDVCPYNQNVPLSRELGFASRPPAPRPAVDDLLEWTVDDYRSNLRGSAMKRAKFEMLQRNARIAGNNMERFPKSRSEPRASARAKPRDPGTSATP